VDAAHFEHFFREMHPRLVRYAKRRLEAESALDVASMSLQTIWSKNLDPPSDDVAERQLQSLAYRIAEGHIRNTLRAQERLRRVVSVVTDTVRTGPAHVTDIADVVVQPDGSEWLAELSLTDREVLALIADGYAVSEVAVILDCSAAAVSMRLQRARRNLKLILGRRSSDG
jgi:RNA polymerase sigma factor (sigma-70 family)